MGCDHKLKCHYRHVKVRGWTHVWMLLLLSSLLLFFIFSDCMLWMLRSSTAWLLRHAAPGLAFHFEPVSCMLGSTTAWHRRSPRTSGCCSRHVVEPALFISECMLWMLRSSTAWLLRHAAPGLAFHFEPVSCMLGSATAWHRRSPRDITPGFDSWHCVCTRAM